MCDCEHLDCDTMCDFSAECKHELRDWEKQITMTQDKYDKWQQQSRLDINKSTMLDALEKEALEKTIDLWNALVKLDSRHPDDISELRTHVHAIQNIIAARPVFKEINK